MISLLRTSKPIPALAVASLAGAIVIAALSGCSATPKPNPTRSAQNDSNLAQQNDDFSKVALANLRKASPVLGMTEKKAFEFIEGIGLDARVVERDGVGLPIDMMYSNSRIDLYVDQDVVIDITVG